MKDSLTIEENENELTFDYKKLYSDFEKFQIQDIDFFDESALTDS